MSNQTVQKPPRQRARVRAAASRAAVNRGNTVRRQTARLEGRRDGKPIIFGWGAHLTRTQKGQLQRLAAFGFMGIVIFAIILTIVFGVIQQNVIIPNQAVVTVDGVKITQDQYRKELAFQAQTLWNSMQAKITQHNDLQTKIQQGDEDAATQDQILISQIQSDEGNYGQSILTDNTIQSMVEDQIIATSIPKFEQADKVPASTFEPDQKAINDALDTFKKAFPANESYANFLSKDNLTDADVRHSITNQLRRTMMQAYLEKKVVSPVRQAHLRQIQVDKQSTADNLLAQLQKGGSWSDLAKANSSDADTKDKGGDMGFVPPWTGDVLIEAWAYASDRKANDMSVVLGTDGLYHVIQVIAFETRDVDSTTLSAAQSNALGHYVDAQKALLGKKITSPDSDMLTASRNLPKTPDLNATLPDFSSDTSIPGLDS